MTSGLQPVNAGAPQPVQGVTGGPGINSGTASVDPGSGALVFHPQPANVVQVRGSTPGAFQVYEYFHTNTDFSRLSLNAQNGGPFQLAVETDPTTVVRELDIIGNPVRIPNLAMTYITATGTNTSLTGPGYTDIAGSTATLPIGIWLFTAEIAIAAANVGQVALASICPSTTGSSGTPFLLQNPVGINLDVANYTEIIPLVGIFQTTVSQSVKLQVFLNANTGASGGSRWSAIKIG